MQVPMASSPSQSASESTSTQLRRHNEKIVRPLGVEPVEGGQEDVSLMAFMDLTDSENPNFIIFTSNATDVSDSGFSVDIFSFGL